MTMMNDLELLSIEELEGRLNAFQSRLASEQDYLASNTKALKRVRRMRGADAYKKRWEFEAHVQRYQARVNTLKAEIALVVAEQTRRDTAGGGGPVPAG
jgi:uncharacterized small protein (DUF1192 family)